MKIQKLSYEDFLLSLRLSPRLSLELILEHPQEGILLKARDHMLNNHSLASQFSVVDLL